MGIQEITNKMYDEVTRIEHLILVSSAKRRTKKEMQENLDEMFRIVQDLKKDLMY